MDKILKSKETLTATSSARVHHETYSDGEKDDKNHGLKYIRCCAAFPNPRFYTSVRLNHKTCHSSLETGEEFSQIANFNYPLAHNFERLHQFDFHSEVRAKEET